MLIQLWKQSTTCARYRYNTKLISNTTRYQQYIKHNWPIRTAMEHLLHILSINSISKSSSTMGVLTIQIHRRYHPPVSSIRFLLPSRACPSLDKLPHSCVPLEASEKASPVGIFPQNNVQLLRVRQYKLVVRLRCEGCVEITYNMRK